MQERDLPTDSFVKVRLKLSISLYYKLLDSIMRDEERKNPDYGALQVRMNFVIWSCIWVIDMILCQMSIANVEVMLPVMGVWFVCLNYSYIIMSTVI